MKRRLTLACLLVISTAGALAPAGAQSGLPSITGGGHTVNNQGSSSAPDQTAFGGFVGKATAEGTTTTHPLFGTAVTSYPAKGEFQGRSATTDGNDTVLKVHGDVVCIADYGPSSGVDGGGNADGDIWEIRFRIERSDPPIPSQLGSGPFYASVMVQDNGREDFADESGDPDLLLDPSCGKVKYFELEPHQGQITVHE